MAKQRPVPPGGRKSANARDLPATPARQEAAPPGPRRPSSGDPSDPRPIAAPFTQHPAPVPRPGPDHQPDDAAAAGATPPARTPGRPMPGPRRTPPAEEAVLAAAHPYPSAAEPLAGEPTAAPAAPAGLTPRPRPTPADRPGRPNSHPTGPGQAHSGNQRTFGPAPAHRPETTGVAGAPAPRPLPVNPMLPGLQLQPMVHVDDMASAVDFYEKLGGEVNHGDRDGEWVLMQVGTAQIGLVTRPPDASRGESTVELNFTATMPLARLERMLRERGVTVVEVATDRDLGTRLHVETPEGMPIKIHQVEPDLMV